LWAFCEKEYAGESGLYEVNERKICMFLTLHLFEMTTPKHIYTNCSKDRTVFMFRDNVREHGVAVDEATKRFDLQDCKY